MINSERERLFLPPLPIYECDLLKDSTGEFVSSTRIRQGKINRRGQVYAQLFAQDFTLTPEQKTFFQTKQGNIVKEPSPQFVPKYVVGDIVLENFLKGDWPYTVGVLDGRSARTEYHSAVLDTLKRGPAIANPAGIIRSDLMKALEAMTPLIVVDGEEDLAAVAAVLSAPLNAAVYYGQPNEGMVEMVVTEELKEKFFSALTRTV